MSRQGIARLIQARSLEEMTATDAEIGGLWRNAVRELRDSRAQGLSPQGAFTHAYQSAYHSCTAVLRASGYRVRGAAGGRHHDTFHAVSALEVAGVSELAGEVQGLGLDRHDVLYDWDREVDAEALARIRQVAAGLVEAGALWLRGRRPALRLATI